jgi:hypothetical protein
MLARRHARARDGRSADDGRGAAAAGRAGRGAARAAGRAARPPVGCRARRQRPHLWVPGERWCAYKPSHAAGLGLLVCVEWTVDYGARGRTVYRRVRLRKPMQRGRWPACPLRTSRQRRTSEPRVRAGSNMSRRPTPALPEHTRPEGLAIGMHAVQACSARRPRRRLPGVRVLI